MMVESESESESWWSWSWSWKVRRGKEFDKGLLFHQSPCEPVFYPIPVLDWGRHGVRTSSTGPVAGGRVAGWSTLKLLCYWLTVTPLHPTVLDLTGPGYFTRAFHFRHVEPYCIIYCWDAIMQYVIIIVIFPCCRMPHRLSFLPIPKHCCAT